MGTMERMRSISPWLLGIIALLFVVFMVISDVNFSDFMHRSGSTKLGSVNGVEIDYKSFEEKVREQADAARAQATNPDEFDDAQIRDAVWNQTVEEMLLKQEAEKLGLSVTDAEIQDIMLESPPEFLRRQFTDSLGRFNAQMYLQLVTNPDLVAQRISPEAGAQFKKVLLQVEDQLRRQLLAAKIQQAVSAGLGVIDPNYVQRQYVVENSTADVNYLAFTTFTVPDDKVTVSNDEIKAYYDQHKETFRQRPSRKIRYAVFPLVPSQADSNKANKRVEKLSQALQTVAMPQQRDSVFDLFSTEFGGKTIDFTFTKDVDPSVMSFLAEANVRDVIGPISAPDATRFYRLDGKRIENEQVKASHILIRFGANKDSAKKEAERLYGLAKKGDDFAQLATQNSQDQGSAQRGGDLGYFAKGQMVKEFETAAFAAKTGDIVGPVESQYGFHIIKVADKATQEIKYTEIRVAPLMSNITLNDIQRKARTFKEQIDAGTPFDSVAKSNGVRAAETGFFRKMTPIFGSSELTSFAFNNKLNASCEPLKLNGNLVVAQISSVRADGIKPLEDVQTEIKSKIQQAKKLDILKSKAEDAFKRVAGLDSLSKATAMDSTLVVIASNGIKDNGRVTGIGQDVAVTSKAFASEVGKIVGPIRGERGYYILQVTRRVNADQNQFAAQRAQLTATLAQKNQNAAMRWLNELKDRADIVDNRSSFYR